MIQAVVTCTGCGHEATITRVERTGEVTAEIHGTTVSEDAIEVASDDTVSFDCPLTDVLPVGALHRTLEQCHGTVVAYPADFVEVPRATR